MTRDEVLAELRSQSEADQRVKYDGHNRRPIALSLKRLRRRRSRRRGRELLHSYLRTNIGTTVFRRWTPVVRDGRCGHRLESFQLALGHALPGGAAAGPSALYSPPGRGRQFSEGGGQKCPSTTL